MAVESFAIGGAVAFFGFLLALLVIRAPSSSGAPLGTNQEASPSGNSAVLALFILLFLVILTFLMRTN